MSFLNKRGRKNEEQIETGLKIVPQEGNFLIIQMQTSVNGELDEIMLTETYPLAETAKKELESLVDWNTTEDVFHGLVVQEGYDLEMTQKMNAIIDKYSPSWYTSDVGSLPTYEEGEVMKETVYQYEESSEETAVTLEERPITIQTTPSSPEVKIQGVYEYEVLNEKGQLMIVKGQKVAEGLSVRKTIDDTHAIDHMASGHIFRTFNTKEQALKCIEVLNNLTYWDHKNAADLFVVEKDFVAYMRSLGKAIDSNQVSPAVPNNLRVRLEYYSQFFYINPENGDFKRFCKAIIKLTDMVGLETVKEEVMELLYSIAGRVRNEGKVTHKASNMHMVFLGPPGTGKTEVARIMSDIYGSLGYLPKGHLIEVDSEDLKGGYEGHTGDLVKEKVMEAMGGTLLIDEAYGLVGGQFGKEAVTTLIKLLEDKKEEFMAILTGYPADIERLLQSNVGFPSRIEKKIHFDDYTVEQLSEIIQNMLTSNGHILHEEVIVEINRAVKRVAKNGRVDGSARTAKKMAVAIAKELNIRVGKDRQNVIKETNLVTIDDVKRATDPKAKARTREELDAVLKAARIKLYSFIGLTELKKEIERILKVIALDNALYQDGISAKPTVKHMVFKGPPGVGKTTIARVIGEYLKGAGVLSSGHFIEVTRNDLVGGYIGHTAEKTMDVINRAKGGILLIDEAYSLARGGEKDFGREAIDTLLKPMEDCADDLVVIFTGYSKDIEEFLDINPGMRSRVPYHFDFPYYNDEELSQLTVLQLENEFKLKLGDGTYEKIKKYVTHQYAIATEPLDNGRWARNVAQLIKNNLADRVMDGRPYSDIPKEEKITVLPIDIPTPA